MNLILKLIILVLAVAQLFFFKSIEQAMQSYLINWYSGLAAGGVTLVLLAALVFFEIKRKANRLGMIVFAVGVLTVLLGVLLRHQTYKEQTLMLSAGEAARFKYKQMPALLQSLKEGNLTNPAGVLYNVDRQINRVAGLQGAEQKKAMIDAELLVVKAFASLEEGRLNNQVPMLKSQAFYYNNTTLLVDAFLKRFALVRAQQPVNLSLWQNTMRRFGSFIAGRVFAVLANPDQAPMLVKLDKITVQLDKAKREIVKYSASTMVTGNKQQTRLGGGFFRLKDNTRVFTGPIATFVTANQTLLKEKQVNEGLLLDGDDLGFLGLNKLQTGALLGPSGDLFDNGYLEVGFYDESSLWQKLLKPRLILSREAKPAGADELQTEQLKLEPQKYFTMIEYVLVSEGFGWLHNLGLAIMLLALGFAAWPLILQRLNDPAEPS